MRKTSLEHFVRCEDGGMSILGFYFALVSVVMSGLAVDFVRKETHATRLQAATDAAAHAALLSRLTLSEEAAISKAVRIAQGNLPVSVHGDAISASDVTFGTWDTQSQSFVAVAGATQAVRVVATRDVTRGNIVKNHVLQFLGYSGFELSAETVFMAVGGEVSGLCPQGGFFAQGVVDVQSNNWFGSEFCMHGQEGVSLNNHNDFETGAIVSMPNLDDLTSPGAPNYASNEGLLEALREHSYSFAVLDQVEAILSDFEAGGTTYYPDYVSGTSWIDVSTKKITPSKFTAGRVHQINCGGGKATLGSGTYSEIVIITDCEMKFSKDVILEDVLIVNSHTGAKAFNSSQGFQLGRNDNCEPGGGAILITRGGFWVASKLQVYGSQVLAYEDINFAAQANGVKGIMLVSGADIDTTSNIAMNGCPEDGIDTMADMTSTPRLVMVR